MVRSFAQHDTPSNWQRQKLHLGRLLQNLSASSQYFTARQREWKEECSTRGNYMCKSPESVKVSAFKEQSESCGAGTY
jgi:hypothetical protein